MAYIYLNRIKICCELKCFETSGNEGASLCEANSTLIEDLRCGGCPLASSNKQMANDQISACVYVCKERLHKESMKLYVLL